MSAVVGQGAPIMIFSQQIPFGFQPQPQTPNNVFVGQSPPQTNPATVNAPPPWAAELIEDVKTIKSVIPKIDHIDETVRNITLQITQMKTRVSGLETKINDIETACNFISNETDTNKSELHATKTRIKELDKTCKTLENALKNSEVGLERTSRRAS